ncbi:MAG: sn-glycerol-3-phosphate ABC transporter ATP-binding protein UgpC [Bryobacterales bacterium]
MSGAALSLRGVAKRYGETRVLDRVDLDVAAGEYLVLVGPSGCGKSTLLRCIAGLETLSAGELWIGERRVDPLPPRDRDVAMVFQSYALYPHMTVRENMAFPLRIRKAPRDAIAAAVAEAARMLDLEALLDRKPAALSGGQRQRVAMGRAIVRQPGVFLFDEPLSNLDATLRHHMRVELKRLHRRLGATIVHVTHDQVEALTLADRIVVLDRGVVQQVGSPRELYDTPSNTFVGTFVGAPSMNLVPAAGAAGQAVLEPRGGAAPVGLPTAAPLPDGRFVLGVRPSELAVTLDPAGAATVDVVESLGGEAMVHLEVAGHPMVALVREPFGGGPGDRVGLRAEVVHRFDPETTQRL